MEFILHNASIRNLSMALDDLESDRALPLEEDKL